MLLRILTKAVEDVGLEWSVPAEPSRSVLQRPAPFFPEVHEELSKTWKPPQSARTVNSGPEVFRKVDGMDILGYEKLPPIEEAIVDHLCPVRSDVKSAATLPSKPCQTTARVADKAYMAAGQAASTLHMMAVLQVYQAKTLRDLDEGGLDSEVFKELRSVTDFTLRAIKTMAQAIGRSMGFLVVLNRHLWLTLTELKDAERRALLNAPVCATGLFGDAVDTFLDRILEAEKQSEVMSRLLPSGATTPSKTHTRSSRRPKQQRSVKHTYEQA